MIMDKLKDIIDDFMQQYTFGHYKYIFKLQIVTTSLFVELFL